MTEPGTLWKGKYHHNEFPVEWKKETRVKKSPSIVEHFMHSRVRTWCTHNILYLNYSQEHPAVLSSCPHPRIRPHVLSSCHALLLVYEDLLSTRIGGIHHTSLAILPYSIQYRSLHLTIWHFFPILLYVCTWWKGQTFFLMSGMKTFQEYQRCQTTGASSNHQYFKLIPFLRKYTCSLRIIKKDKQSIAVYRFWIC